jgi:hypothetical protein
MKTCPTCKKELDENCFGKNKSRTDGLSAYCKNCRKEYGQRPEAKEKQKEYQKEYYQDNRERRLEYAKEYQKEYKQRSETKEHHKEPEVIEKKKEARKKIL